MIIKPIETFYRHYRFRSRAEARWAVFFDALGIPFIYEPEGFEFDDGTLYLPDFYLPTMKTFFEVKGIMSDADYHKISSLGKSGYPVAVGYSDMTFQSPANYLEETFALDEKEYSCLAKCQKCGNYYFIGYSGSFECLCCGHYDGDSTMIVHAYGNDPFDYYDCYDYKVRIAFTEARQARFEHGESG